ncbi:MAG: complex I subunit 4 family protein [Bacteriovoracaceae bacterium]
MDNLILFQFFFPLIAAISFYMAPLNKKKSQVLALVSAVVYLILTFNLVNSVSNLSTMTTLASYKLDNFFGLSYAIGIDGLSGVLITLNALLLLIVVLSTLNFDTNKFRLYYFSIFTLSWSVNGALLTENLYAFYIFWEAMLIPLFILVGVFGGDERKYASYKFFIFTAAGSFIMLGSMMYMSSLSFVANGSYDLTPAIIKSLNLPFNGFYSPQALVFAAFCLALFIKVPVFPFHSWLPDAHVQAPTAGSIILAGVLLKLGIYGLLRFVIPVYPQAVFAYKEVIITLGAMGVVYGALTAIAQNDIKKVVAFSSISHMGYIVAGIFSFNEMAVNGAIFQMISHGITTGGLFIAVHCLYVRRHTKLISEYGGVAKVMPVFAVLFFIMLLGSMAVPLTNGFVGEFLIIWGVYKVHPILGFACALGVILAPVYLLTTFQKVMLGPITNKENETLKDISKTEMISFVILGFLILLFGIYPKILSDVYGGIIPTLITKV